MIQPWKIWLLVGRSLFLSMLRKKWFEDHYNDKNSYRFVIETKEDGPVGIATLVDIDWKNRRTDHGIKISSHSNRAKGIGTDAVMAIMRYAFDELGLNRLDTSRFDTNEPSKKLYPKCEWKEEGVRREYVYKNGSFRNLTIIGILRSEYYALIEKNHYWDI